MIAIPGNPYPVIVCFCFRISKELMRKSNHYHQAPNCKYNTHITKFLLIIAYVYICLQQIRCLHDLWATLLYILGTPHRKTPRWSPSPLIASFSILDRSVRQSGRLRRFDASLRGSAGVQPTKYVCVSSHSVQSFLVMTNFNTTLSDVRVF